MTLPTEYEHEPDLEHSRAMLYYYPKFKELIQQMLQNDDYNSNAVLKIVMKILNK